MSQLHSAPPVNRREPLLAFLDDAQTIDIVRSVANERGWRTEACKGGGLRAAVQALSVATSPQFLVVDLSDSAQPLTDIDHLAEVCEPGTLVIAVGMINDVAFYRELIAKGVHDYLPKPLPAAMLNEALERALNAASTPSDTQAETVSEHAAIAIVGARGGVGASMLAASVAWLLSHRYKRSTALLDLDIHFGTGALAFDLEPGRGLADAIEDPMRIDGLFIERAMTRVDEKLAVLSAEAPLGSNLMSDGSAFVRLEHELRQGFEATVIDLPRQMMLNFPHLLGDTAWVIVTCELTLACARDAIRILSWLKSNAPSSRIIVVANKVPPGQGEISRADFAAAIERKVDFAIACDPKAAMQAARLGQSFVEANRAGKTSAPIQEIVRALLSEQASDIEQSSKPRSATSLLARLDPRTLLPGKARPVAVAQS